MEVEVEDEVPLHLHHELILGVHPPGVKQQQRQRHPQQQQPINQFLQDIRHMNLDQDNQ